MMKCNTSILDNDVVYHAGLRLWWFLLSMLLFCPSFAQRRLERTRDKFELAWASEFADSVLMPDRIWGLVIDNSTSAISGFSLMPDGVTLLEKINKQRHAAFGPLIVSDDKNVRNRSHLPPPKSIIIPETVGKALTGLVAEMVDSSMCQYIYGRMDGTTYHFYAPDVNCTPKVRHETFGVHYV